MTVTCHVWIWSFFLLLSIVTSAPTDTTEKATTPLKVKDVNKTITKVESILKKNPNLPRLTRGEILSLLDNITKADAEKKRKQQALNAIVDEKARTEYERALMVVLPFQANGNVNNSVELQKLYTRSPITAIVEDSTDRIQTTTKRSRKRNHSRRKPTMQERPIVVRDEPIQEQRPVYVHKSRRKSTTTSTTTESPSTFTTVKTTTSTESNWKPYTGMELRNPQPFGYHNEDKRTDIGVPEQMKQTLLDIGIPKNHKQETVFVTPQETTSTVRSTTTTTTTSKPPGQHLPDISLAVQSLTPEMRNLLISFGLLNADGTPATQQTTKSPASLFEYKPISPTVDPSSYVNFKPLPNSREAQKGYDDMNSEMKTFLASYGLMSDTPNVYRSQKALNNTPETTTKKVETTTQFSVSNINTDILNDDMKNVLENLGLMKSQRQSKGHIFNPVQQTLTHSNESERISKLIGTIKQFKEAEKNNTFSDDEITAKFENITAGLIDSNEDSTELVQPDGSELSYEGYEPADEELLKLQNGITDADLEDAGVTNFENDITSEGENQNQSKTLQHTFNAPDPLSSEELTQIHQSYKNEVKRQQPTSSSSNSSTESSDDTTTEGSTTSKDASPSLTDLEDSFGGANPTTSKPNGLYFLVDWNTFLRVGTDNSTVDLNFAPKVGDPKNFLPVTVP